MKSFVVDRYGKDAVRAADVPAPDVGSRHVRKKVSAASINPLNGMVRNGEFKQLTPWTHARKAAATLIDQAVG